MCCDTSEHGQLMHTPAPSPPPPLAGLDKIEQLQQHPNEQIYELAVKVITNYFPTDSEEESERD